LAPALVAVYISYYLDRQTARDPPDIDHSRGTFGWRLVNCFGFAAAPERRSAWPSGLLWPRNSRSERERKPPVPFSRRK